MTGVRWSSLNRGLFEPASDSKEASDGKQNQ